MLRINNQLKFSEYERLYDLIIPKDNILRKINETISRVGAMQQIFGLVRYADTKVFHGICSKCKTNCKIERVINGI